MTSKLQNLIDSTHAANFRIRAQSPISTVYAGGEKTTNGAQISFYYQPFVTKNTFQLFPISGKDWHAFHRKSLSSRWYMISARNRAAIKHLIYTQPFLQPEPANSVQIPSYKYYFLSPIPMFPKRNQNKIIQISRSGWHHLWPFVMNFCKGTEFVFSTHYSLISLVHKCILKYKPHAYFRYSHIRIVWGIRCYLDRSRIYAKSSFCQIFHCQIARARIIAIIFE